MSKEAPYPPMCPGDTDFCPHHGCTTCQGPLYAFRDPDQGAGKIAENDDVGWVAITARYSVNRTEQS